MTDPCPHCGWLADDELTPFHSRDCPGNDSPWPKAPSPAGLLFANRSRVIWSSQDRCFFCGAFPTAFVLFDGNRSWPGCRDCEKRPRPVLDAIIASGGTPPD